MPPYLWAEPHCPSTLGSGDLHRIESVAVVCQALLQKTRAKGAAGDGYDLHRWLRSGRRLDLCEL
jgi:hypothetical protein